MASLVVETAMHWPYCSSSVPGVRDELRQQPALRPTGRRRRPDRRRCASAHSPSGVRPELVDRRRAAQHRARSSRRRRSRCSPSGRTGSRRPRRPCRAAGSCSCSPARTAGRTAGRCRRSSGSAPEIGPVPFWPSGRPGPSPRRRCRRLERLDVVGVERRLRHRQHRQRARPSGEVPWNCPLITCGPAVLDAATRRGCQAPSPRCSRARSRRPASLPSRSSPHRSRLRRRPRPLRSRREAQRRRPSCAGRTSTSSNTPKLDALCEGAFTRAMPPWKHRVRIPLRISSLIDESISACLLEQSDGVAAQGFPGTMANSAMRVDDPLSPGAEPSPHQAHETSHAGGGRPAAA